MTVTATERLGITRWSSGTDPLTRAQLDASHAILDNLVAIDVQGVKVDRPAPGKRGRYYRATDTGEHWRDDGAQWVPFATVTPNGDLRVGVDAVNDDPGGRLVVSTDSAGVTGVRVRTASGATAAALVTETDAGDARFAVFPDGSTRAGRDPATRQGFVTVRPPAVQVGVVLDMHPDSTNQLAFAAKVDAQNRWTVDALGRQTMRAAVPTPTAGNLTGTLWVDGFGRLSYRSPVEVGGAVHIIAG